MKKQLVIVTAIFAGAVYAQGDRVVVPLSDPSRPGTLKANLTSGSLTVRGYDGKEIIVESKGRESRRPAPERSDGLRRIDVHAGLTIEEQDNVVQVSTGGMNRSGSVQVQVPLNTSLRVGTMNNGNIVVERVSGELDVNNLNGDVTMTQVGGAVVAHSLNGDVTVTMDRVTAGKPMSFSTLNGDIDVTLPPDLKARVKIKSDNGDVYSDFDIQMEPASRAAIEDARTKGGKYRVVIDKAIQGTINGGGPEIQFTTLNGKIFIRKKK